MLKTQQVESLLEQQANALDEGLATASVGRSLSLIADAGWLGYGVPESLGGSGGTLLDTIEAIATVSGCCLTSGFVFWCQRAFIEYLVRTQNSWLQSEILPKVLRTEISGATGLSNAMKHLAGIEPLRLQAQLTAQSVTLTGFLPWVSNLQPNNFLVAVAAQISPADTIVVAIPSHTPGLQRGEDLQLLGLQASWTSTLKLNNVELSSQWIISEDAQSFLPQVRSAFILLQCGLSLGLVRRALQEIKTHLHPNIAILQPRIQYIQITLEQLEAQLRSLSQLPDRSLLQERQIFELRIAFTRLAIDAVGLELEAKGGMAYFKSSGTARRLREVGFLAVLTPSLVQLETELQRTSSGEQKVTFNVSV
ncbi:acyl-CoA dehydrogenase family protein [Alkalinema sp. FACHB-956]|uniref:acyl-CoA dehydrogenase family protein n=1 Tax=Alkalinema sp. FACHB-956 TaxID=2692768 RepID=UPI001682340B|nr:acyl-CoA dehydrogenase family protein [Alkalinema sp. FACHB-956]MBD2329216.1 acyl-CoA/acyl-ACP dehydrogenase [Alkalinema sp. FACHB-956]